MSVIAASWLLMAAASLTLGLVHLLVWFRQRRELAHLLFFFLAASAAAFGFFELALMRAASPQDYAATLRWAQLPLCAFVLSIVGFVRSYFGTGRLALAYAICGLRLAAVVLGFTTGANVNFREVTGLDHLSVFGIDTVSTAIGVANPWTTVPQVANLLLLVFIVDATVSLWRRNRSEDRRRARLIGGSLLICVALAAASSVLILTGAATVPTLVMPAVFVVVLAMGIELSHDLIDAAQLATRLHVSEAGLRASEQRMQLATAAAGIGVWEWDIANDQVWMTKEGRTLFGFDAEQRLAIDDLLQRVHADDREAVAGQLSELRSSADTRVREIGYRIVLPGGRQLWLLARRQVEKGVDGRAAKIRGVSIDVTERRQAEDRFRAVVEAVPSAILLLDGDERIVLANPQVRTVFGYSADELIGRRADSVLPASWSQQRREPSADASETPVVVPGEERVVRRKDDTLAPVEISVNALQTAEGTYWLVSIVDVSERSRLMQAASRQREELAHLSRVATLGALSGSLAHELNQPLAAILSNAQAAQRFLAHNEPRLDQVAEILADIVKNDRRAAAVIQRLRALLKKEQTQMRPVDVNELTLDALRLMHSDFVARGIEVETNLAKGLPGTNGDRVQLQQVLLNFLLNGCEAMDDTAAQRRIIVKTAAPGAGCVRVSVGDRGAGISKERLGQIFEPFVTTKPQGLGLGLAICRSIIEAHGGKIWAEANEAGGATLTFELPAAHSTVTTLDENVDRVRG